jgi:hypothetical protein
MILTSPQKRSGRGFPLDSGSGVLSWLTVFLQALHMFRASGWGLVTGEAVSRRGGEVLISTSRGRVDYTFWRLETGDWRLEVGGWRAEGGVVYSPQPRAAGLHHHRIPQVQRTRATPSWHPAVLGSFGFVFLGETAFSIAPGRIFGFVSHLFFVVQGPFSVQRRLLPPLVAGAHAAV